jgi:hypothetical protein
MRAARELQLLAEDEVSYLRSQGREAEADRRSDAWQREINRALGEAAALREALARPPSRAGGSGTAGRMATHRRDPQPARLAALELIEWLIVRGFRRAPLLTSLSLLLVSWAFVAVLRALAPLVELIDVVGSASVLSLVVAGVVQGWRQR